MSEGTVFKRERTLLENVEDKTGWDLPCSVEIFKGFKLIKRTSGPHRTAHGSGHFFPVLPGIGWTKTHRLHVYW